MFNKIMQKGINKIYSEMLDDQKVFIEAICKRVRHMDSSIIYKAQGFFVPNQDFLRVVFGAEITNPEFDVYNSEGFTDWDNYLIFPMYNVLNEIVGLVGFNPINKLKSQDEEFWSLSYYKHSSSKLMDKSKYIFMLKGMFSRAINEGYIIITDGVFDMLSGAANNLVTGALLGSTLSQEVIAQLKLIDKIYLAMDNDEAGQRLLKLLRKYCPNTRAIIQGKYKDLDDILKSQYKDEFLKLFYKNLKSNINTDIVFR